MRECRTCRQCLPEEAFSIRENGALRTQCKPCRVEYSRQHTAKYKEYYKKSAAERYQRNREAILAKTKAWATANSARVKANRKRYFQENKVRLTAMNIANRRKRRHTTIAKLEQVIEKSLRRMSAYRAKELLGCSLAELEKHLVSGLHEGVVFGKECSIDHIIPLSAWNASSEDEYRAALHWTNLQTLSLSENSQKGGANVTPKEFWRSAITERLLVLRALEMI